MTEMTGAEMVMAALADQGVEHIFGYPGGAVLPIYDALFQQNKVRHILVRHEQGAVHAAEGYARSTGKVGSVLVTSGPGATNAVTGLTDALCDSIPLVVITGQVPTHLIGNDAFQECDTVGITRPCTKYNYLVKNVADLPRVAARGVSHRRERPARAGRGRHPQGHPVRHRHLLQAQGIPAQGLSAEAQGRPRQDQAGRRDDGRRQAPAVLYRRRRDQFRPRGERTACANWSSSPAFPITSTLMGLGAFPAADPQWLGMLGMHGTWEANWAMHDCDLMICRRRALRRPHHRPARRLLAGLEENPHRHRSVLDQQERQGRSADRRRLRACARRHAAHVARAAATSRTRRRSTPGGRRSANGGRRIRSPIATPTRSSSRNTPSSASTS